MGVKQTEALKLALEALEDTLSGDLTPYQAAKTITVIREALAEQPAQQQEPVAVARVDDLERGGRVRALAMGLSLDAPLYTSPPAQQQEPVAYSYTSRITGAQGFSHHPMPRFIDSESWDIKPLYDHPPASKPLTDEEIVKITADPCLYIRGGDYRIDIARAIEAAHGIKENT